MTRKNRYVLVESGLRDINNIAKRYKKAKIYFHQDLDGVTTALAMKNYLEQHGIKVVDCEVIQYGDKEFAIKKADASGEVMPVLVDYSHGRPMFVVHTDHHSSQVGVEKETATSFRHSRSNVETISQVVSPKEIFPSDDILLISTVDSANFASNEITPEMVMNYLFKFDKDSSLKQNKMLMGLVTNKLLLAFKNKPKFLETIVMEAKPSLISILNNIKKQILEKGYVKPEILKQNQETYVQQMKSHPNVKVEDGIIIQYGGGNMMKPGSYDRYTPFRNNPEADFIVIAWPLGLVQASCNPFKKERALKGINLGEIAQEVLSKWESQLKEKYVSLSTLKWISESGKDFGPESVGFTFKDFMALYGDYYKSVDRGDEVLDLIEKAMLKPFTSLTEEEMKLLDDVEINVWDLIQANSGGHSCITNVSSLNYIGRSKRPPKGGYKYDAESEDAPYVKFTKMIQKEFVRVLKEKMKQVENITESVEKKNLISLLKNHINKKNLLSEKDWDFIINELDCVIDNRGQWDHPGECTLINSNTITMKDVPYSLVGIDDTGEIKFMLPEKNYNFPGKKVLEIPLKGKYMSLALKLLKKN